MTITLKAQQIYDATIVVSALIRENRPMPLRGKYLLARLHGKLLPEFATLDAQRNALITAYDFHPVVVGPHDDDRPSGTQIESPDFSVPADKLGEFAAEWATIAGEEIDLDAKSIPLDALDLGGESVLSAGEVIILADLLNE